MKYEEMKIKAILFDLDGTIFNITERDAFARYQALNQIGYNVPLNRVKELYHYGLGRLGIAKELGIKLSEEEEKEYIQTCFDFFADREIARNLTKIHAGAHDTLATLSQKYTLLLVTSRDTLSSTEEELEWFKIRSFFTLIVTREVAAKYHGVKEIPLLPFQDQRKKLFECAIGLTEIDPEDTLCVGDSIGELQPARELGIKAIGVLTGFDSKENMEEASIPTIQDITQLVTILN